MKTFLAPLPIRIRRLAQASVVAAGLSIVAVVPHPFEAAHAQQWVSNDPGSDLREAVRQLGRNPENIEALIVAGDASLQLGDADAAAGFFLRGEAIDPANGRIKLGLARAKLRQEDPVSAISLFEAAAALGQPEREFAADKGLAYDLIGDFESAQRNYRIAQQNEPSKSLSLRMAISYIMSGDRQTGQQMLNGLLTNDNSGAWRAQAFVYASQGEMDKAQAVAESFLGRARASQLNVYLSRMPRLTVAQQMAAIHFGHFPRDSYGTDNAAIAAAQQSRGINASGTQPQSNSGSGKAKPPAFIDFRGRKQSNVAYTPPSRTAPAVAAAASVAAPPPPSRPTSMPAPAASSPDAALAQAGRNAVATSSPSASPPTPGFGTLARAAQEAAKEPFPDTASSPAPAASSASSPASIAAPPSAAEPPSSAPAPAPAAEPTPAPAPANAVYQPSIAAPDNAATASTARASGASLAGSLSDVPDLAQTQQPVRTAPAEDGAEAERDLSALVSDITIPESERQQNVVPVTQDLIEAERPDNDAPNAAPDYPARNWVQIATGSDLAALGFDFRRYSRQYDGLFEDRTAWVSPWRAQQRLLVGPFDNFDAANEWAKSFRDAGGDGFVWQSEDGTVVDRLP